MDKVAKKIVLIIPFENYDEEELEACLKVFKDNFEVKIASLGLGYAKGNRGGSCKVDKLVDELSLNEADAFVFINGEGSSQFNYNFMIAHFVKEAFAAGKILGAISRAPFIFALCGILAHKRVTGLPEIAWVVKEGGGYFTGLDVEKDGNIITALSSQAALKFAKEIALALKYSF